MVTELNDDGNCKEREIKTERERERERERGKKVKDGE